MLNRSKLWAAILLLAVFAAGAAAGGTVWSVLGDGQRPDGRPRSSDDRRHGGYSELLKETLGLSVEQSTAVDSIMEIYNPEMREIWVHMRAQIDTIRSHVSDEILTILDEEQQEQFRELMTRSSRRGERERAPRNH